MFMLTINRALSLFWKPSGRRFWAARTEVTRIMCIINAWNQQFGAVVETIASV